MKGESFLKPIFEFGGTFLLRYIGPKTECGCMIFIPKLTKNGFKTLLKPKPFKNYHCTISIEHSR